jgi:hypothetical protein
MIGQVVKFKYSVENTEMLKRAYDVIQLSEPHEAGEIINDHWLIVNSEFSEFKGKYEAGYYVKIVNLKFCDIIETDIDHNRSDLRKINTWFKHIYPVVGQPQTFRMNVYEVRCK